MESLSKSLDQASESTEFPSYDDLNNKSLQLESEGTKSRKQENAEGDAESEEYKNTIFDVKGIEGEARIKMLNTEKLFKNTHKPKSLEVEAHRTNIFSPIKRIEDMKFDLPSPTQLTKGHDFDYRKPIYVCKNCEVLLGYEDIFTEMNSDYSVLKALFNYRIDDNVVYDRFTVVYCVKCNCCLGVKIKSEFFVYTPILQQKTCKIRLGMFSLKMEELNKFSTLIEKLASWMGLPVEISKQELKKSALKAYSISQEFDACVLIHTKEGRLLLTDTNGIYAEFLVELNKKSKGNFLVILNNFEDSENPQESENFTTFNSKAIETLATAGKQPLLQILAKDFRIITLNEDYSSYQITFLKNFLHKSLYKSIITEDLLEYNKNFALPTKNTLSFEKSQKGLEKALLKRFQDNKELMQELTEEFQNQTKDGDTESCTLI